MIKKKISNKLSKYNVEFKHLTVLLIIVLSFQIILSFIQKSTLQSFLENTQEWYQKDSAERMANLSTTSLEILVRNMRSDVDKRKEEKQKIIQSFNIIFSQQLLEPNVEESYLIILKDNQPIVINDGTEFYNILKNTNTKLGVHQKYQNIIDLFFENSNTLQKDQEIFTVLDSSQTFHTFVPFIPYGEFFGVFYMRNKPNFDFITHEILTSFNGVAIIFTSLILLGLLAMYYISSFTVKQRDEATQLFYKEQEQHLKDSIDHEKESMFTKRIYHTHHKAEKIMGFIKEDLRKLSYDNMEVTRNRVNKYSNFVSRVIYDMKWYDPPIQTIRNPAYNTDINSVIKFIIDHLFLRLSSKTDFFKFELNLDDKLPPVHINEFIIWEIIEPLIQNSIDHSTQKQVSIKVETIFDLDTNKSFVFISDDGNGLGSELLETNKKGIKKIFTENVSTKTEGNGNRGYGCYIAHQIVTVRCGWRLDVENLKDGGCKFIIEIQN